MNPPQVYDTYTHLFKIALPKKVRLPSDYSSAILNIGRQLFDIYIFQGTEKTVTNVESAALERYNLIWLLRLSEKHRVGLLGKTKYLEDSCNIK